MTAQQHKVEVNGFAHKARGRCIVVAHGDRPVSDEEMAELHVTVKRVAAEAGEVCMLVYAAGDGGPNAKQRASLKDMADIRIRTAIVTDSRIIRTILTAISWIVRQPIRAFDTNDASAALDYLELTSEERTATRRLVVDLISDIRLPALKL